jgi:GT2 family glycosyltransferase
MGTAGRIDVVVVSYNSRDRLRDGVEPLARAPGVEVLVVDNASPDDSPAVVEDLPVEVIRLDDNRGFAHGCNVGWRAGSAPYVLFLNPDARIAPDAIERLAAVLDEQPSVGAVAPKIVTDDGALDYSQRRFPRLRSTYARALFLHRLFPNALWTDEVVRDAERYERSAPVEWVSGACMLVRRSTLEQLGGMDDGFFMYCEDKDLCRRIWGTGGSVRFEPSAVAVHEGGASAPRDALLPVLAHSRALYARKHSSRSVALIEQLGVALGELTHVLVSRGGWSTRLGHLRSLRSLARAGH